MDIERILPALVEFRESPFFYEDKYIHDPSTFSNFLADMEYALLGHGQQAVDAEIISSWFGSDEMEALRQFIRELEQA